MARYIGRPMWEFRVSWKEERDELDCEILGRDYFGHAKAFFSLSDYLFLL